MQFLLHTYIKRKLAKAFKSLVSAYNGQCDVLQVTFSENAIFASQQLVSQSNYTSQLMFACIDNETNKCIVLISDDLNYTKYVVYIYRQFICGHLRPNFPP